MFYGSTGFTISIQSVKIGIYIIVYFRVQQGEMKGLLNTFTFFYIVTVRIKESVLSRLVIRHYRTDYVIIGILSFHKPFIFLSV